jgi:hypothetical protein
MLSRHFIVRLVPLALLLGAAPALGCAERIRERVEEYLDAQSQADVVDAGPEVPTCDDGSEFTPCGGSPVGEWKLDRWCVDSNGYDPLRGTCEELAADGSGAARAELRIFAEGDYRLDWLEYSTAMQFVFPLSCFGGSTTPCSGTFYDGECELLDDECLCDVANEYERFVERGFWTGGARLLVFETSGVLHEQPFCVSSNRETLQFARYSNDSEVGFVATFTRILE